MQKKYKICQSCGMPMTRDKLRGGTERNGEKSAKYCSHCYMNGQFMVRNISAEQMKERVQQKLSQYGFPRFIARFSTRNIHKLERWSEQ